MSLAKPHSREGTWSIARRAAISLACLGGLLLALPAFAEEGGEQAFNWMDIIPGLHGVPYQVSSAILVALVLIICTSVARLQLNKALKSNEGAMIPERHLSFRNFFEIMAELLFKLTENVIGEHEAPVYFPVIGSLFLFIFTSNLLGLIPGFEPPTADMNTTLALGIFVFIYYNFEGIQAHGWGYVKHFLGPVVWLAPLMLIIELASHVFRPVSLALRLRGNIMGDHAVLSIFNHLVPYFLPVVFYGIGMFVAFIQAFVFCLLTMVYISLSTAHDH